MQMCIEHLWFRCFLSFHFYSWMSQTQFYALFLSLSYCIQKGPCFHLEQAKPAKRWSVEFCDAAGHGPRSRLSGANGAASHRARPPSRWSADHRAAVHGDAGHRQHADRGPHEPASSLNPLEKQGKWRCVWLLMLRLLSPSCYGAREAEATRSLLSRPGGVCFSLDTFKSDHRGHEDSPYCFSCSLDGVRRPWQRGLQVDYTSPVSC